MGTFRSEDTRGWYLHRFYSDAQTEQIYTQPAEDARKHTGFNAARSAHVPDNYPSASPMVPMRLGHSSSKATVSPAELFARPASTMEVNRAPDHAFSRATMHPPVAAAPRLERAAEKALFRLENDVGAHRELGWTHACRHSRLNSHCDKMELGASRP